jgi:hypothetical protein
MEVEMPRLSVLIAGSALALLAADWREAGVTSQGNRVFVSDVKGKGDMRSAWIRIAYKEPLKTPDGMVKSSRAKVRVNCKDMTAAAEETIMYADEAINHVASRKKLANEPFAKEPGGSFGDVAVKAICSPR